MKINWPKKKKSLATDEFLIFGNLLFIWMELCAGSADTYRVWLNFGCCSNYDSLKLRRVQKWRTQVDRAITACCFFLCFALYFSCAAVYRTQSRQALIKFHDFYTFPRSISVSSFSVLLLLLLRSVGSKYNKFNPIQSNNAPKCLLSAPTLLNTAKKHFYFTWRLFWVFFFCGLSFVSH